MSPISLTEPFGVADCIAELKQGDYKDVFLTETPYNEPAMRRSSYLIRGRRGAGKTALAAYFGFQSVVPDARCVVVDQAELFREIRFLVRAADIQGRAIEPQDLVDAWRAMLWSILLSTCEGETRSRDLIERLGGVRVKAPPAGHGSSFVSMSFGACVRDPAWLWGLSDTLSSERFAQATDQAKKILLGRPLILALDTAEHYYVRDDVTMPALGALVEAVARVHREQGAEGLHLKLFVADESFHRSWCATSPTRSSTWGRPSSSRGSPRTSCAWRAIGTRGR